MKSVQSKTATSDKTLGASESLNAAPADNPDASLAGEQKRRYVQGMFSRIAGRYDLMNSIMSLGQDALWRRYVIARAAPAPDALALDVTSGTGLIAQQLARAGAHAFALDLTLGMMLEGKRRGVGRQEPVTFVGGDALKLPFADSTFDCVTTGFGMRNVIDIGAAFREMHRVLKPGGRLVCLEVGKPHGVVSVFHGLYTQRVLPLLGRVIAGDADAYSYLPSSMGKFPPPDELARLMRSAGLRNVRYKQLTFGAVAVHRGVR